MNEEKQAEWTMGEEHIRDMLLRGYNVNECIGKPWYEDEIVSKVALIVGSESKNGTNLLFLCGLLVNMSRELQQPVYHIICKMGERELRHISNFWDVLCAENIDEVTYRYIEKYELKAGTEEIKTSLSIFQEAKVYVKVAEDRNNNDKKADEIQLLINLFKEQNSRRERTLEAFSQLEKIEKETHMWKIDPDKWIPPRLRKWHEELNRSDRSKKWIIIEYSD